MHACLPVCLDVAAYSRVVTSVLSYPMFFCLMRVFQQRGSMWEMETMQQQYFKYMRDPYVVGSFVDNHDNSRFLCNQTSDPVLYYNALVYMFYSFGVPILYYGTEQGLSVWLWNVRRVVSPVCVYPL